MTNELQARILSMLTSLMEVAEAMPTDIVGPADPFTLAEMLTLLRLEADFGSGYSEAMQVGLEARERLDADLPTASTWRYESAEEIAARDAAAMVQEFVTVTC